MAESGMERGHGGYPGLLMSARDKLRAVLAICLIGLFMPFTLVAQTDFVAELEEPLRVILRTAPDTLVTGGTLVVTILVEYPQAAEVNCEPPPIPWGLALRGVRLEPELVPGVSGTERWTRVEYQLELREAGDYLLGSFSIEAGGRRAETAAISLTVLPSTVTQAEPVLYWSSMPASLVAGTPIVLELRASGLALQDDWAVEVDVPENALLENLKSDEADTHRDGSVLVVARFRLTPLSSGLLRLPQASIRTAAGDRVRIRPADTTRMYRVSAALPVNPDRRDTRSATSMESMPEDQTNDGNENIPEHPELPTYDVASFVPRFIRASAEAAVSASHQFWEQRDYPAALAILRRAERDTLAGWTLRSLRAESERVLGLPAGFDEPYTPRIPLLALASVTALSVLMAGFLSLLRRFAGKGIGEAPNQGNAREKKDSVTIFRSRGFFIASLCVCIALASFARLAYVGVIAGQRVVLTACAAFRVPDPQSVQAASFADGECVRSRSRAGNWLYVESVDGRAGWIDSGIARKY